MNHPNGKDDTELFSKKVGFTRTCKLKARCPLSPASGGNGNGVTKFSSVETFFRVCLKKQEEILYWGTTSKKKSRKNPQCEGCRQGKASQRKRIVVVLSEMGIEIDESMLGDGV